MAINLFAPIDQRFQDRIRTGLAKLKHRDEEPGWLVGLFLVAFFLVCGLILFAEFEIAQHQLQSAWTAPPVQTGRFAVTVHTVHDADTISRATIHFPLGIDLRDQSIRAANFDAWEIARGRGGVTISDDELAKGRAARASLVTLLEGATLLIELDPKKNRDDFGRVLGKWFVVKGGDTIDVAEWSKAKGHVRQ